MDDFDKMSEIIYDDLRKVLTQSNKVKSKVAYAISRQRRVQKKRQKIKENKFSSYKKGIKRPRSPKKPRSY